MQSPSEGAALTARVFSLCLLMSAALQIMENLLPRIPLFPWLKLGLSHLILLPFLLRYGTRAACMLLVGRNLLSLLFAGGALTTFMIGSASGAAAMLAGGWAARAGLRAGLLGMAGAGMLLAALMNLAQLAVAEGLLVHHGAFYFQLAPMLAWSAVSGVAVAWLAWRALPVLEDLFSGGAGETPSEAGPARDAGKRGGYPWAFTGWLILLGALFIPLGPHGLAAQGMVLAALLCAAPLGRGWKGLRADLVSLARGWPWLLYLAWLHLYLGEGELLWGFITRPGAENFLFYSARLANLILLGPRLAQAFPVDALGRSSSVYLRGLVGSLPLLPGLHAAALACGRQFLGQLRGKGESPALRQMLRGFRESLDASPRL